MHWYCCHKILFLSLNVFAFIWKDSLADYKILVWQVFIHYCEYDIPLERRPPSFQEKKWAVTLQMFPCLWQAIFSFAAFTILSLNIFISLKCQGINVFVLSSWKAIGFFFKMCFKYVSPNLRNVHALFLRIFYASFYLSAIVICVYCSLLNDMPQILQVCSLSFCLLLFPDYIFTTVCSSVTDFLPVQTQCWGQQWIRYDNCFSFHLWNSQGFFFFERITSFSTSYIGWDIPYLLFLNHRLFSYLNILSVIFT